MCGIYATNKIISKEDALEKLETIRFRGPDNLSVEKSKEVTFGHLRLSIIDTDERSNQPFNYENYTIVFNGEIYNFEDIRKELLELGYTFKTSSDTEVLIIGYAHWGHLVLQKLNGMFAFVVYDSNKNELFGARDRLGVKPFFYSWDGQFFEICSQLRPMLTQDSKISNSAVSAYLQAGYVPTPMSIIEGIKKLEAGSYFILNLNSKKFETEKYWDLTKVQERNISYDQALNELETLLEDAVRIRLRSDVPIGTFLSGGIDSALVTALASKISDDPISTFTIGFTDGKFDESKVAEQYAAILKTNHTTTIISPDSVFDQIEKLIYVYDEPFNDSSAIPSLLLNKVTKQYVTVALSGDGGDESFLGYRHFDLVNRFQKISVIPRFIRRIIASILPWHKIFKTRPETMRFVIGANTTDALAEGIFLGYGSLQKKNDNSWLDHYRKYFLLAKNPFQRVADFGIKLWLENDSNVKVDRASMAYSVEVRSPFLDYRVIEFARKLPVSYRYSKQVKKKMLRDLLKKHIPEEVFNQPKKGFSMPIGKFLRGPFKDEIYSTLTDEYLNSVHNLNVSRFKWELEQHMEGTYDFSYNIWKLYLLARWQKQFNLNFK